MRMPFLYNSFNLLLVFELFNRYNYLIRDTIVFLGEDFLDAR